MKKKHLFKNNVCLTCRDKGILHLEHKKFNSEKFMKAVSALVEKKPSERIIEIGRSDLRRLRADGSVRDISDSQNIIIDAIIQYLDEEFEKSNVWWCEECGTYHDY